MTRVSVAGICDTISDDDDPDFNVDDEYESVEDDGSDEQHIPNYSDVDTDVEGDFDSIVVRNVTTLRVGGVPSGSMVTVGRRNHLKAVISKMQEEVKCKRDMERDHLNLTTSTVGQCDTYSSVSVSLPKIENQNYTLRSDTFYHSFHIISL
ncbi:hypothetical protein RJT34_24281 [Clitoria ternatea]|uniref:Uncharacterized protein n=1 Tax=Clitoria ternatea TaxID=43366 RepID=A0AAN9IJ40_CLITE